MGITRDDFRVIVKGLKASFPEDWFIPDKGAFDLWYMMLNDLSYDELQSASLAWIQTHSQPPKIADLRQSVARMMSHDNITEEEAWALVRKAVNDAPYHARERFDELPAECKRAVGSPNALRDMAMLDYNSLEVAKSNFLKTYRIVRKQEEENRTISPRTRELIYKTAGLLEARGENDG